jgi:hypothetical protein
MKWEGNIQTNTEDTARKNVKQIKTVYISVKPQVLASPCASVASDSVIQ